MGSNAPKISGSSYLDNATLAKYTNCTGGSLHLHDPAAEENMISGILCASELKM